MCLGHLVYRTERNSSANRYDYNPPPPRHQLKEEGYTTQQELQAPGSWNINGGIIQVPSSYYIKFKS